MGHSALAQIYQGLQRAPIYRAPQIKWGTNLIPALMPLLDAPHFWGAAPRLKIKWGALKAASALCFSILLFICAPFAPKNNHI